jgi:aryl-alcohol dehydrogenase-like predicted oxidoreductase
MAEGRWAPYFDAAPWDTLEAIREYAHARDLSMLDVAIGGLLARPAVASVIAGATTPDQVRTNAAAARWQPSEADMVDLDGVAR